MIGGTLSGVGRRKSPDQPSHGFPLTEEGARLLLAAKTSRGLTYREIGKMTGVSFVSIRNAFEGVQASLIDLPHVCRVMGVPFYRTQHFRPDQREVLVQLERLHERAPDTVAAAVHLFTTYVRGLVGPPDESEGDRASSPPAGTSPPANPRLRIV